MTLKNVISFILSVKYVNMYKIIKFFHYIQSESTESMIRQIHIALYSDSRRWEFDHPVVKDRA